MNKKQLLEEILSLKQDLTERVLISCGGNTYDHGYDDALNFVLEELEEIIQNA